MLPLTSTSLGKPPQGMLAVCGSEISLVLWRAGKREWRDLQVVFVEEGAERAGESLWRFSWQREQEGQGGVNKVFICQGCMHS